MKALWQNFSGMNCNVKLVVFCVIRRDAFFFFFDRQTT